MQRFGYTLQCGNTDSICCDESERQCYFGCWKKTFKNIWRRFSCSGSPPKPYTQFGKRTFFPRCCASVGAFFMFFIISIYLNFVHLFFFFSPEKNFVINYPSNIKTLTHKPHLHSIKPLTILRE